MMALSGIKTIVADLDLQANATRSFLTDEEIESLWDDSARGTIYGLISPLIDGIGDIDVGVPRKIAENLWLIPGDLALSAVEDDLSTTWPKCLIGDQRALRVTTAFSRMIQAAGLKAGAEIALIDVGPNLGAINRSSLVACDYVVVPLSADLFAIRGLQNVGPSCGNGAKPGKKCSKQRLKICRPDFLWGICCRSGMFFRGTVCLHGVR